jgi:DeoR/GlpR family transcriptional regulator of sugar metabolism
MLNLLNRTVTILDILAAHKTAKISMLTEVLNISHVTLRKDLDILEKRGIIKCTHGSVSLDGANNTGKRMAFNYLIKRKIAKAAAAIVEENETVMLEAGSCCAILAEELALSEKNVTIITNSVFIANYISDLSNMKIILLGGCYQSDSQVVFGPMTINSAQQFYTDKFFLGTDGFIPGLGFTEKDYLRVETAIGLATHANKVYILTEAEKFSRRGTYTLIQLDKLSGVFTDDNIPKEAEADLLKSNLMLYKVPGKEEEIRWRKFPELPPILYKE